MPTTLNVPLVLGHEEDQQLLERTDLPAAGWIERVYRHGDTLYADFSEVPPVVEKLLNRKAYRTVSAELYPDLEVQGKRFGCALRRVALLGGEQPQLKSLGDVPPVANGKVKGVAIFQAGPDGRGETWPVEALDQVVRNFEKFKFAAYSEARVGHTVVCFYDPRRGSMTATRRFAAAGGTEVDAFQLLEGLVNDVGNIPPDKLATMRETVAALLAAIDERLGGDGADDVEMREARRTAQRYAEQFRRHGSSAQAVVRAFSEQRKTDRTLTAKRFFGNG